MKGGGIVTVEVHPKGLGEKERLLIRYDSNYPHRRWPTLPRGFSDRTIDTLRKEFNSPSVIVRQQAMLAAAKFPTLEENLRAGMRLEKYIEINEDSFIKPMAAIAQPRQSRLAHHNWWARSGREISSTKQVIFNLKQMVRHVT